MIDANRIRQLPLAQLRQELLECQKCFTGGSCCAHHEDVVGGYKLGSIVLVGLNPQAPPRHVVYSAIQAAPWEKKRDLSDRLFDIFLNHIQPSDLHAAWTWTRNDHPGIRPKGWLPMACEFLKIKERELAEHVLLLETFKHATADKKSLRSLPQWPQIQDNCPVWVREQIERLKPRLVVLCGDDTRLLVAPHLLEPDTYEREIARTKVTKLHGKLFASTRAGRSMCVMFCIGISKSSRGWWAKNTSGTSRVQKVIRAAVEGRDPCTNLVEPS